jgi:4-hydroxyphenylpyruvate dioxygenase-like putative hemolysin
MKYRTIFDLFDNVADRYMMVGSKAIPTSEAVNDIDYLVYVIGHKENELLSYLYGMGYKDSSHYQGGHFKNLRKGEYNIIVTTTPEFYDLFETAVNLCIAAGTRTKEQRVAIHDLVMGKYYIKKKLR